jgi:PAT family beta-lactamase induction signal transducer AmpG
MSALPLRRKLAIVAAVYFVEGFPFAIFRDVWPVYFRVHGVSLTAIGWMSLLGLPWTWKFLWSPLVDRYGDRRTWIAAALVCMGTLLLLLPAFDPGRPTVVLWALLLAFCVASATQDIAIDAYTIGLLDEGEEGAANGVRVSAYRGALVLGGGGLVLLPRWIGWEGAFLVAALAAAALAAMVRRCPPVVVARAAAGGAGAALRRWLARPGAVPVLLFVVIYKLGDAAMGPMVKPFWIDRGLTPEEIGLVSTTLGVGASVLGALLGGAVTSRTSLFTGLWALGLAQAFSNLGYAAAAHLEAGRAGIYAASLLESFTGGLGTAAFLAFLMHVCDKRHAAVEYALLSALFAFSRDLAGGVSGWAATQLGYPGYFALTFALALPAYALLPWVRPWAGPPPAAAASAAR